MTVQNTYKPSESLVNFAVPDRKILDKLESPVQCGAPGILIDMIDTVSSSDPNQIQSYKLCVDGKKINSGTQGQKLGDINLYPKTLQEVLSIFLHTLALTLRHTQKYLKFCG